MTDEIPENPVDFGSIDIDVSDIPRNRRHPKVEADAESFIGEVGFVIERHENDLTSDEIIAALMHIVDSYSNIRDVNMKLDIGKDEDDEYVALIRLPDADPVDVEFFGDGKDGLIAMAVGNVDKFADRNFPDIGSVNIDRD